MNTYEMNAGRNNLLIVDDKPENIQMLKGYLNTIDIDIFTAMSAKEALDHIRNYEFALLLLDSQVLDIDCLVTADIPIIFIADTHTDQGAHLKRYEVGTVDFLTKPIEPVILRSKVRIFLAFYSQKKLLNKQAELLELRFKELHNLKEVNCQLESLSSLDGLTGIPNRRHFDQSITQYWKNAMREQKPLSLVMIDIDNFKAYNDTYGHVQGDDCLILVSKALASSVNRPHDFVARYGGEEFIAVLPNSDKHGAALVAERMRKCIEKLAIKHQTSRVANCVTISLGVAEITPKATDSLVDFINNADNALYMAKQLGRNKVHLGNLSRIKANREPLHKKIMYRSFRETIAGLWLS